MKMFSVLALLLLPSVLGAPCTEEERKEMDKVTYAGSPSCLVVTERLEDYKWMVGSRVHCQSENCLSYLQDVIYDIPNCELDGINFRLQTKVKVAKCAYGGSTSTSPSTSSNSSSESNSDSVSLDSDSASTSASDSDDDSDLVWNTTPDPDWVNPSQFSVSAQLDDPEVLEALEKECDQDKIDKMNQLMTSKELQMACELQAQELLVSKTSDDPKTVCDFSECGRAMQDQIPNIPDCNIDGINYRQATVDRVGSCEFSDDSDASDSGYHYASHGWMIPLCAIVLAL